MKAFICAMGEVVVGAPHVYAFVMLRGASKKAARKNDVSKTG